MLRHDQEGEAAARREPGSCGRIETIIGSSPATAQVCNLILTVAESDSTVLLLGDSGTGKELAARAIHRHSRRARRPLIAVNCAAIPENLLESELFGHVRGSFTGAIANRPGRFSLADGGTIFLDEIGDMTPKLQVKVLRVLQEQEFEAVGATETTRVNVRVIAATNQDLEARVKEKKFREDLFYRLNVIPIRMPSLRERIDDIPELIDHFIARFNQESGSRLSGASAEALALMRQYPWPGNIRELENLIERLSVLVGEGEIGAQDLPEKFHGGGDSPLPGDLFAIPPDGVDLNKMVDEYETRLILQALRKSNGVKNQAAKLLRIKRTTLVEKMKKKNIQF
ncbi:MAG: Transcriptional regulatory protein ZraR [candidate division BRC1 bacterium ADurb.BinA364]|nr:MAG: Transcriptional regulatory protein ZraR [candidate division BRC1 bacterium ADurb.BinA364]